MKKFWWKSPAYLIAVLILLVSIGKTFAGAGSVESGGYLSFPKIKINGPIAYPRGAIEMRGGDYLCINHDCTRKFGGTALTGGDFHFTDAFGTNFLRVNTGSGIFVSLYSMQVQGGSITSAGASAIALSLTGAVADGSGAIALKIGNTNALTAGTDRYILKMYRDNMSTEVGYFTSEGSLYVTGGAAIAMQINNGTKIKLSHNANRSMYYNGVSSLVLENLDIDAAGSNASGNSLTAGGGVLSNVSPGGSGFKLASGAAYCFNAPTCSQLLYFSAGAFTFAGGDIATVNGMTATGLVTGTGGVMSGAAFGYKTTGVVTGSLPACNATAPPTGTRGSLQYDLTETCYKYCNGSAWSACLAETNAGINMITSAFLPDIASTGTTQFGHTEVENAYLNHNLAFTVTAVGTGTDNMTISVLNDSAVTICQVTVPCNSAVGTVITNTSCGDGSNNPGDLKMTTFRDVGCTANPQGNATYTGSAVLN